MHYFFLGMVPHFSMVVFASREASPNCVSTASFWPRPSGCRTPSNSSGRRPGSQARIQQIHHVARHTAQVTLPGTEMDLNCFEAALSLCLGMIQEGIKSSWVQWGTLNKRSSMHARMHFLIVACTVNHSKTYAIYLVSAHRDAENTA